MHDWHLIIFGSSETNDYEIHAYSREHLGMGFCFSILREKKSRDLCEIFERGQT